MVDRRPRCRGVGAGGGVDGEEVYAGHAWAFVEPAGALAGCPPLLGAALRASWARRMKTTRMSTRRPTRESTTMIAGKRRRGGVSAASVCAQRRSRGPCFQILLLLSPSTLLGDDDEFVIDGM
mgnify:CR=1 FL=1